MLAGKKRTKSAEHWRIFFLRYGEVDVVKVLVDEALADLSVA